MLTRRPTDDLVAQGKRANMTNVEFVKSYQEESTAFYLMDLSPDAKRDRECTSL
eukprot:m.132074 g.132074  ORF g.132074 m.132074 type:complete len:54 (+) comp9826_c0_seq3:410-571(+)